MPGVLAAEDEAACAAWGLLAPVPERWRLHLATTVLPKHHSLIHGVATSHRAFSPSLRLAHRWLNAHRLQHQIPVPAVELLVARAFLHGRGAALDPKHASALANPASVGGSGLGEVGGRQTASGVAVLSGGVLQGLGGAEGVPATALHGLQRFLLLLATHDFARAPLVVEQDPYSPQKAVAPSADGDGASAAAASESWGRTGRRLGLVTSADVLAIEKTFETVRATDERRAASQAKKGGGSGGTNSPLARHPRASALWVVAPYDRDHGWLASWGVNQE